MKIKTFAFFPQEGDVLTVDFSPKELKKVNFMYWLGIDFQWRNQEKQKTVQAQE